jgi:hypothetical protein
MAAMFNGALSFNQNLSNWCVSNIPTAPTSFAAGAANWTLSKPVWGTCPVPVYYPLTNTATDPTNATWRSTRAPAGYIFVPNNGIYADEPITDMNSMFVVGGSLFNDPDIVDWDVSTVTDMTNLFSTDGSNTIFAQDISSWNVLNVLSGNTNINAGPGFFPSTYHPIWGTDGTIPSTADVWISNIDYVSDGGWTTVYGEGAGFNPGNTLSIMVPSDNALAAALRSARPGDEFYTFGYGNSPSAFGPIPQRVTMSTTFTETLFDSGGAFPEADGVWISFYATLNEPILDNSNNPDFRVITGKLIYYPSSFGGYAELNDPNLDDTIFLGSIAGAADDMLAALNTLSINDTFEWTSPFNPDPNQRYTATLLSGNVGLGGDWRFQVSVVPPPSGSSTRYSNYEVNRIFIPA